ncbi:hypothetical protein CY34DRAFT_803388 [Suillus luteus UH-Slu-Lm8-n1]|uniref:Uncharacterized protein n=1 Tax=Suillus luteus UH-Slu-Lm8-n1 TaxID=930992 RepID=A0A0D0B191_9AGAM|nr:hypothetical protein CY34DRAFT_803388 [Suillus luteus UH-Slu-Lm8-n1]
MNQVDVTPTDLQPHCWYYNSDQSHVLFIAYLLSEVDQTDDILCVPVMFCFGKWQA